MLDLIMIGSSDIKLLARIETDPLFIAWKILSNDRFYYKDERVTKVLRGTQ